MLRITLNLLLFNNASLLIRQFLPKNTIQQKLPQQPTRLSETVPANLVNGLKSPTNGGATTSNSRPNLVSTDKFFSKATFKFNLLSKF